MRILGVDPSITSTGLAIIDGTKPVWRYHWGVEGHNTDGTVVRNNHIYAVIKHMRDVLGGQQFDVAAIEGRAHGARYGNPGEREALRQGIVAILRMRKTPMAFINPKTRALWATGDGNADKKAILAAVKSWWPGRHITDHNEADAFVLALMFAMKLGEPMPFEVTQRHRGGIEIGEWPIGIERTA